MTDKRMIQLASIAAMKGILSNEGICDELTEDGVIGYDDVAEHAMNMAKALARKWEEME